VAQSGTVTLLKRVKHCSQPSGAGHPTVNSQQVVTRETNQCGVYVGTKMYLELRGRDGNKVTIMSVRGSFSVGW